MKKTLVALSLVLTAAFASGCIITSEEDSSLTIDNASSFVLIDIAVRDVDRDIDYGPTLLSRPLGLDERITVLLDCGVYDVMVIDEDNFSTELFDLDLCFDDAIWVVTDADLGFAFRELPEASAEAKARAFTGRVVDARKK